MRVNKKIVERCPYLITHFVIYITHLQSMKDLERRKELWKEENGRDYSQKEMKDYFDPFLKLFVKWEKLKLLVSN